MSLPIPASLVGKTQALFYEFRHQSTSKTPPVYTLKNKDWEGCKSVYLIYMQYDSEYEAAIAILGSWPHWCKLKETSWFKPCLEEWDKERAIREDALAHKMLIQLTKEGNVTAAKALKSGAKPQGRPSNKKSEPRKGTRAEEALLKQWKVHNGRKE